jgi:hypothetical protein
MSRRTVACGAFWALPLRVVQNGLALITCCCLLAGITLAEQPKCPKGYQPFADRCVSQRMSDYITCVESSGANKEAISLEISNAQAGKTAAGAKGSGSGVVAKGSGSLTINRATEEALATKFEEKWGTHAMEECRKVLDPPRPIQPKQKPQASNKEPSERVAQINAPQGFAIGENATVYSPTVNNFGPPGNDEVMRVRVMAVGLINSLERSIADAYQDRAFWTELGQKQPDKYPQRIVSWHLEGITTGFDREYQSEYRVKIVEVRHKLEEHTANPPPPFIGRSRYSLYRIEDGIPVPPQRAEAQLYDLCSLLTQMEQENKLPVTFPGDSIENKVHSDAAATHP